MRMRVSVVAFCLVACKGDPPAPPPPPRTAPHHGVLDEAEIAGYIAAQRDGDHNPYDAVSDPKTHQIGNRANIEHDYASLDPFAKKHGFADDHAYARAVGVIALAEI